MCRQKSAAVKQVQGQKQRQYSYWEAGDWERWERLRELQGGWTWVYACVFLQTVIYCRVITLLLSVFDKPFTFLTRR